VRFADARSISIEASTGIGRDLLIRGRLGTVYSTQRLPDRNLLEMKPSQAWEGGEETRRGETGGRNNESRSVGRGLNTRCWEVSPLLV
jgi:hypothetical protein